jgi:hypothetical protein
MSRTRLGSRWNSGAYSKYRARVRGTNVTLTSPRSAIFAIGLGRSSMSKKRRRNWADSHSMFHCPTAPTSSMSDRAIESATYSGGAGSSGRTTPLNRKPADMFFRLGNSSGVASPSGRNTPSRRHSRISAAVGSRSSLTGSSACRCAGRSSICVIPPSRQSAPDPFRPPRQSLSGRSSFVFDTSPVLYSAWRPARTAPASESLSVTHH